MKMFEEKGGGFSWRKGLTCIAGFCFLFSVIMYIFGYPELPSTYQAIITGVFGAYFLKDRMRIKKGDQNQIRQE